MIQSEYLTHVSTLLLEGEPGELIITNWGSPELPILGVISLEGIKDEGQS